MIAQGEPYEGAAACNSFREEAAWEPHDEHPGLQPAPELSANLNIPEQATAGASPRTSRGSRMCRPCPQAQGWLSQLLRPSCGGGREAEAQSDTPRRWCRVDPRHHTLRRPGGTQRRVDIELTYMSA
jgi:hypothetical protein